jgi:hypothetical protein
LTTVCEIVATRHSAGPVPEKRPIRSFLLGQLLACLKCRVIQDFGAS